MKKLAIAFAIVAAAVSAIALSIELQQNTPRYVELANLVVLTLTLVVLVWYAYDTNAIATVTRERWTREGVLGTSYNVVLADRATVGDHGRTLMQFTNASALIVRANVNCNFQIYGIPVSWGELYDGRRDWILYPNQFSQGWFEIEGLLQHQGKSVAAMQSEANDQNRNRQLTMHLALRFTDELGVTRNLPPRKYYFDFRRWAWIPELGA